MEGPQHAYSICLSVRPSVHPSGRSSIYPSVRTSICPSVMYETKLWWIFWSRHLLETYVNYVMVPGNTFSVRTSSNDPSETKCETTKTVRYTLGTKSASQQCIWDGKGQVLQHQHSIVNIYLFCTDILNQ